MKKISFKSFAFTCMLGLALAGTTVSAGTVQTGNIQTFAAQEDTSKVVEKEESYVSSEKYNLTSLKIMKGATYHVQGTIVIKGTLEIEEGAVLSIEQNGSVSIAKATRGENEYNILNHGTIQIDTKNGGSFLLNEKISLEEASKNVAGTVQIISGEKDKEGTYSVKDIWETTYGQELSIPNYTVKGYAVQPNGEAKETAAIKDIPANKAVDENYKCSGTYNSGANSFSEKYHILPAEICLHVYKAAGEYKGITEFTVEEGKTLSDIKAQLVEGFSFVNEDGTDADMEEKLTAGEKTLYVNYSDKDKRNNYENVQVKLTVTKKTETPTKPPKTDDDKPNPPDDPVQKKMKEFADKINNLGAAAADQYNASRGEQAFNLYKQYQSFSVAERKKLDKKAEARLISWNKLLNNYRCGEKSDTVYYAVTGNTLTIFGKGKMKNCFTHLIESKGVKQVKGRKYHKYSNRIKTIVVKNGISYIGNGAFAYMNNLSKADIQGTNTSLGIGTFFKNKKLSAVTFKAGGKGRNFGFGCFAKCAALKSIIIPQGVSKIDKSAFYQCKKLTTVDFPASLTNLGDTTFMDCKSLKTLKVRGNTKKCGKYAFYGVKKSGKKTIYATSAGKKSKIVKIAKKEGFKVNKKSLK